MKNRSHLFHYTIHLLCLSSPTPVNHHVYNHVTDSQRLPRYLLRYVDSPVTGPLLSDSMIFNGRCYT